jgi:hypothetical protein
VRPRFKVESPREVAVLVAIVVLALALRLDRIGWSLPSVYEEATPFKKAWDMWGLGSLWGFGPLRGFDPNPHWFQYPTLTFYLQWAGQALTIAWLWLTGAVHSTLDLRALYLLDKTPFYLVGRGITALFGAATVLPAWGVARRVGGVGAAILAGLLVAIHPLLVAKSKVIEVDVPLAFFVTLGLLMTLRLAEHPTRRNAARAGIVAGLAASTKYPGLVLLAPMLLALWRPRGARASRAGAQAKDSGGARSRPPQSARTAGSGAKPREGRDRSAARTRTPGWIGLGLVVIVTCVAALFVTSPYLLLAPSEVSRDLTIGRQLMTLGHFGVASGMAYGTYLHDWFNSLLGWPLGIAAIAGLAWGVIRRTAWGFAFAALLVPYLVVVGSWQMKADRYLMPIVPAAAISGALCVEALASALARRAGSRLGVPALAALGLVCAAPLAAQLPAHWASLRTDTRQLAREWIERHLPPGSMVVSEVYGPDLVSPVDLADTDDQLRARLGSGGELARVYALQTIPMFVMAPERSDKFYRLEPYAMADAIVVTSAVRERYRGEPARYRRQVAFYDSLSAHWPRVARFEPGSGPGPAIDIYRNPAGLRAYGARGSLPAVDSTQAVSGGVSGGEAYFYYNLGVNAEWFGYPQQAQDAYLLALRFGATEPRIFVRTAMRLAGHLRRQGKPGAALAMLEICSRRAPGPEESAELQQAEASLRRALSTGGSSAR